MSDVSSAVVSPLYKMGKDFVTWNDLDLGKQRRSCVSIKAFFFCNYKGNYHTRRYRAFHPYKI